MDAVAAQRVAGVTVDVLVVDSGSADGSPGLARDRGARVIEVAESAFGHGRTRNLAAEATTGDLVAFLTQDATPVPGWLEAIVDGFSLADDVGAVYGPHLPREDTSPMIARELDAFFAGHADAATGGPAVARAGGSSWLSNVNAAYRRDCWAAIRFDDIPYSEDLAFGQAMLAAGWAKVFHPGAAVRHAHDYPPVAFARRYFDEYRGLRASVGHVEPIPGRRALLDVRGLVAADRAWMAAQGYDGAARCRWTARSVLHHSSRKGFGALGARAHRLPPAVQRRLSLEGTVVAGAPAVATGGQPVTGATVGPRGEHIEARLEQPTWQNVLTFSRAGITSLLPPIPGHGAAGPLHLAVVIPPFQRGSGGHMSLFQLLLRLERKGHTVSLWIDDEAGLMREDRPARIRRQIRDWFVPLEAPVFKGFDDWFGADVAVATGWQTAHSVAMLSGTRARAYIVQDHEPEFYATSAESRWAADTYRLGFHHLCGSPYLEAMVASYGGTSSRFSFGVDHELYHPRPISRDPDTVVVYGRDATPRRAVPLAILALTELLERRPRTRVVSFGSKLPVWMPFPHEHLGVLGADELARAFGAGSVGFVLSMTNYSVIPQEMLACGMPVVELAGVSGEGIFGDDGGVTFAEFDPVRLADALERLLDDREEWARRSAQGIAWAAGRSWDTGADEVEAGLREALRLAGARGKVTA
ncbi:glycosyltransferase [Paraconexibacter antarcticus]|uniref:4,4'-diaponeurosporenoate glycosyltransferase n=1 Tax=Paraconexibacter antarcticus TaxID=2949664 RepID=A0ABY5DTS6_9ACTN|nr:glycosyltransferase [Paraconexibacter antarcticus]